MQSALRIAAWPAQRGRAQRQKSRLLVPRMILTELGILTLVVSNLQPGPRRGGAKKLEKRGLTIWFAGVDFHVAYRIAMLELVPVGLQVVPSRRVARSPGVVIYDHHLDLFPWASSSLSSTRVSSGRFYLILPPCVSMRPRSCPVSFRCSATAALGPVWVWLTVWTASAPR